MRLDRLAAGGPDRIAFRFLADGETEDDRLTYGDLAAASRKVARSVDECLAPGSAVLLLFPPGLEFITAFMGVLASHAVAVPLAPPRTRHGGFTAIEPILAEVGADVALTATGWSERLRRQLTSDLPECGLGFAEVSPDGTTSGLLPAHGDDTRQGREIAYLQYTSGSTGRPKGVVVTHAGLQRNLLTIQNRFQATEATVGVHWLPPYHDMGLVGGICGTIHAGATSILMPPAAFVQRPARWLTAITTYRGTISGGPDFAYRLLVDRIPREQCQLYDLGSWEVAFCGAERVRPTTMRDFADKFAPSGFRETSLYPCYGMAEATLFVAGRHGIRLHARDTGHAPHGTAPGSHAPGGGAAASAGTEVVSCGRVDEVDGALVIVDPESKRPLPSGATGEIWLCGPSVAAGYRGDHADNERVFRARLAPDGAGPVGTGPFLRTGDLGTVHDGELFIVGRSKDIVIIRGRNHAAEDLESTVERTHDTLLPGGVAAVAMDNDGAEGLAVLAEVRRNRLREPGTEGTDQVIAAIREGIALAHGITPTRVVLLRPRQLPTTASGKIRRSAARADLDSGRLRVIAEWRAPARPAAVVAVPPLPGGPSGEDTEAVQAWLADVVGAFAGVEASMVDMSAPLGQLGLDSVNLAELAATLGDVIGADIPLSIVAEQPDLRALGRYLAAFRAIVGRLGRLDLRDRTLLLRHLTQVRGGQTAPAGEDAPEATQEWEPHHFAEIQEFASRRGLLQEAGLPNPFYVTQHSTRASRTVIDDREYVSYSSNDYLGMQQEPSVREAAKAAIDTYGTSAFASRIVSGDRPVHRALEAAIRDFLGVADCLVFGSANMANLSTVGQLLGVHDMVVYDERSHDSLLRGIQLSGAAAFPFRHNDPSDAERVLAGRRRRHRRALIFIEGLYSMDGDVPDLPTFVELRRSHRALLMVDECLSIGVLGDTGRGIGEHHNVPRPDVDIWMGGISKAFASCGGYIAGDTQLIDYLRYSAPGAVFTTGPSPANSAAALASIEVLIDNPQRPGVVRDKARRFRDMARANGLDVGASEGHLVVPIIVRDPVLCLRIYDRLLAAGISTQPVLHPAVPADTARLRLFVTYSHTDADLQSAINLISANLRDLRSESPALLG